MLLINCIFFWHEKITQGCAYNCSFLKVVLVLTVTSVDFIFIGHKILICMLDMSYIFPGLVASLQSPCSRQNLSVLEVTFLFVEMMVLEFALWMSPAVSTSLFWLAVLVNEFKFFTVSVGNLPNHKWHNRLSSIEFIARRLFMWQSSCEENSTFVKRSCIQASSDFPVCFRIAALNVLYELVVFQDIVCFVHYFFQQNLHYICHQHPLCS